MYLQFCIMHKFYHTYNIVYLFGATLIHHICYLYSDYRKKIIRIITNSDYFAHTQPLFKEKSILKLFDINKIQIGIYMYKLTNIGNNTVLRQQHNYPTRTRGNLLTPVHHLTIFQHSISFTGPKVWNSVPEHIKLLSTLR